MVAKFLDLNNLSSQQQPFALSNDGSEAWATVLLLSAIIHRKVIHVNFFSFFFLPDLQDHSLLRSRHFATMVTQHDNFSPLLQSLQTLQESYIYIHLLKLSASDHKYTCIHGWNGRQQYIYIYIFLTSDNLLKCAVKTHFYDQAMIIHVQCTVSISTWPKGGVKFSAFVVFR